jgi:hypothetical protein
VPGFNARGRSNAKTAAEQLSKILARLDPGEWPDPAQYPSGETRHELVPLPESTAYAPEKALSVMLADPQTDAN